MIFLRGALLGWLLKQPFHHGSVEPSHGTLVVPMNRQQELLDSAQFRHGQVAS